LSTIRPTRKRLSKAGSYAILIVMSAVMFSPIYYLLIGSFKPSSEVLDGFTGFLPIHLSLQNYLGVFKALDSDATGYFWRFMGNSVAISLVIVLGGLVVNSMAGYSFARLQWRGKNAVFVIVVLLIIVPFESVAVPLLFLLNGQRDTLFVQMIPFVANAFSIFLFYTFFLNLPKSIEEAARLDGLGAFGTFARVVVPNARPVFATVAILTFLSSWGSYLWPSIVTSDPTARPLPLEMSVFSGQTPVDWGQTFAFGTLLVLPVLIVFLAFQRFFIQSVAGSAVKG
jgi:multiple sugar transport system permease protein